VDVEYLSAEHGVLKIDPKRATVRIGQRLEFVPGYVDFTTVLHDHFCVIQDNRLIAVWPLEARGKLQ
jgi:D-serine deaminase-like pyridoxal phosphate-dependent protein